MLAPYGGLVTGPAASNWYRTTAGRSAYGPVALNHRGGDAGHTGTICPPTPAQSGASKAASKPRSQPRSNVTSSSVNASTRPSARAIPAFSAKDFPRLGSPREGQGQAGAARPPARRAHPAPTDPRAPDRAGTPGYGCKGRRRGSLSRPRGNGATRPTARTNSIAPGNATGLQPVAGRNTLTSVATNPQPPGGADEGYRNLEGARYAAELMTIRVRCTAWQQRRFPTVGHGGATADSRSTRDH